MAGELKHITKGTTLTQAEFEHVDLHACNSQATGDLIYASSSSQLSRLAIGAADTILTCNGTIPSWSATPILNTAIAKGEWTASGTWTIPAVTLGGAVAGGDQTWTNVGDMTFASGSLIIGSTASVLSIRGKRQTADSFAIWTPGATPGFTDTFRFYLTGGAAICQAAWAACTHTGFVLGGALDAAANYMSFTEMAAPGAGAANTARIYAVVDGGTLTDLAAVFQDGTVDIFAQEVTPLDAPTFTYPSGTEAKIILRKAHPGLVTLVARFTNGKEFVIKEYQYHDADKVAANLGCEKVLPADWVVETKAERLTRLEAEELEKLAKLEIQAEASK